MAGLRLEHIYKVYPNGTKAVSDFTMDIKDQEFIVFVGPSGCGKSTTLRMIAGLEEISAGELYIDNHIVNDVEPKDRDIAMVFQNYALYPHMTVYENIAFSLKLRHVPNEEIHKKVLWAAQILDLTEYLDRKPKAMSGGQRQRVALGRAIIRNPKVMLLDEPLSNLDAKLRAQMRNEIANLHQELKTTFIYVTHDQVEAMTLGTRVVVMKLGKIMQIDTPKNLYDYPANKFVAGFIGTPQMNFFTATIKREGLVDEIRLVNSSNVLKVEHQILSKVQPKYFTGNREVILGLRCEHLSLDKDIVNHAKTTLKIKINNFEELGNETLTYGELVTNEDIKSKPISVIVRGNSTYGNHRGDVVDVAVDMTKAHLFDGITEEVINPQIPTYNLISGYISKSTINLGSISLALPPAIDLQDGEYNVIIPVAAVKLNQKTGIKVQLEKIEKIASKQIVTMRLDEHLLFAEYNDPIDLNQDWFIDIDYPSAEFYDGDQLIQKPINTDDRINAMFLNHITAKQVVGNRYDALVTKRVEDVENHYQTLFKSLQEQLEIDLKTIDESKQINHPKDIIAKNKPLIAEKTKAITSAIETLKNELRQAINELTTAHKMKNVEIIASVKQAYDQVYNNEIESFNSFKAINKDRDAYRKRALELRQFKSNHQLELQNEMNKRLNAEAIEYDTEMNALKGNFKREKEGLLNELKQFKADCYNEAYPNLLIEKTFKQNMKALQKEYSEALQRAKIIFFFKTGDLVTLTPDEIANKMIQSLGVKVFTKQYLVEIPHDAYSIVNDGEGIKVSVESILDYGQVKYAKCLYREHKNENYLYIQLENTNIPQELTIKYDISRIHVTEKAMDIKIY